MLYNKYGDTMNKRILSKLNKVAMLYNIGQIKSYEEQNGTQNKTYKVTSNDKEYIIKEFSKDAINNSYSLSKRKEQLRISLELNKKSISCITPLKIKNKYFRLFDKHYYLVYDYSEYKSIEVKELSNEHIISLATLQAKLHKLNIKTKLPCTYKKIDIDFNKMIKKYKNEPDVYKVLLKNKDIMIEFINKSNSYLKDMKQNLCLSHNDYKTHNILWNNLTPVLIDFDAMGKVNPICALCESAYTFSKLNKKFDLDRYKLYLETYISNSNKIKDDFQKALYVSMNGKLRWYNYLLSKKDLYGVVSMTNDFVNYYKNIEKFNDIYQNIQRS